MRRLILQWMVKVKKVVLFILSIILVFMAWAKFISGGLSRPFILPGSGDRTLPQLPGEVLRIEDISQTFFGYYVPAKEPSPEKPLAILTHGNAESMPSMDFMGYPFYERGYALLYIEYPGYGIASGSASEESIYRAFSVLADYVRTRYGHTTASTLVVGRSVGGGPAVEFLHRGEAGAGLLVSTFTSINAMARRMVPGWLADLVIKDRFDNIKKSTEVHAPVFLVHGDADGIVPVQMSRELNGGFANSFYLELAGAGHNDIYMHMDSMVWSKILGFFAERFEEKLKD